MERVRCLQCGHTWLPRFNHIPIRCANVKCQSAHWNDPNHNPRAVERIGELNKSAPGSDPTAPEPAANNIEDI